MATKRFKGKALYNPSGRAGEYNYWACNFYTGCSNNCDYCYCKRGVMSCVWHDVPVLKSCFKNSYHALGVFRMEVLKNIADLRKYGVFFSFTTDPMLPETIDLTFAAIDTLISNDIPVKVLTKRSDWVDSFLSKPGIWWHNCQDLKKHLIAFGFTLTGHDELEPHASTNSERIDALKKLHLAGFKTFASIEPIVDFPSSMEMIERTTSYCDLFKIGLMSGKKYDVVEAQTFVEKLNELPYLSNFYLKENLQALTHYRTEELPSNFVGRDYNMFKK